MLHRKEKIIVASVELIDEAGLHCFSTRGLARRVGVSEATIFKHFRTKNDLLLAVIEHYAQYDKDIARTVEIREQSALEAIRFFMKSYAEMYENYPAITSVLQLFDLLSKEPYLSRRIKEIFQFRFQTLCRLLDRVKENHGASPGWETSDLADILMGLSRSATLRWRLSGCEFSLKEKMMSALETVLKCIEEAPNPFFKGVRNESA